MMEPTLSHEALLTAPLWVHAPWLVWIPALPLLAFVILILGGRRLGRLSVWLSVGALAGSCAMTLVMGRPVFQGAHLGARWAWLSETEPRWAIGLSVDGLSWLMLCIVTTIGTMIALYSIGYMHGDPRVSRFFAYLSLFCASMLGLVLADHFVLLYACWELVGLCSYLLISFWFEKPSAAAAGRKAFLTTRIGDAGLLLGILLLAWASGTLHFSELSSVSQRLPAGLLTAISLLVFLGAVGKSAQVPLHVWLPDAMEGPTPVSALIHAATMVAAGVYLVARTMPLFTPESLQVVLVIGLLTHLLAGTVALTMTDIKRILAYSTISQLGLMVTALGLGASGAAMFHLFTHAWFKALLFLVAGSVIHATHQQELSQLGGLWRRMPWTASLALVASLSMGGLVGLSGFWSKDAVLLEARRAHPWLMGLLVVGASVTAGYIFRWYFRCFLGAEASPAGHATSHAHGPHAGRQRVHESPLIMVAPMAVLALGAACAGMAGSPWLGNPLGRLLGGQEAHEGMDLAALVWSSLALIAGAALAWVVGFQRRTLLPGVLRPIGRRLYAWAAGAYGVEACYARAIITPVLAATEQLSRFDQQVIDGAVNGAGNAGRSLSQWKERFDRLVVDRLVNGLAATMRGAGAKLRWIQTGIVQQYLLIVVMSVVVCSAALRR